MADDRRLTDSGIEIKPFYGPDDLAGWEPATKVGKPGEYPYARGIRESLYRARTWTIRPYSGFGTAEATNERWKLLLAAGSMGLSCAFDLPTQMGLDSDNPRAEGEVGKVGVAIDSIDDMRLLLDGMPLDQISTSMTINSTASILLLLYQLVAEERGVPGDKLNGTIQNDILKEYVARGTYVFPPRPSMRIITDIFSYCNENIPQWNTISISGYHIREAGSTAVQEIAFTIANGIAYVEAAIASGMDVDDFAPQPVVLLERPQQLLRRGREVPRRPSYVGARHDRALRGQEGEVEAAAIPHADRWFHAHGAAAREQHHARHAPSPRRGDGWHAVAAHQRIRRSAGSAHAAGGDARAAHPAGDRQRVGCRRHDRSARRFVVRRERSPTRSRPRAMAYIEKIDGMGGAVAAIEAGFMQDEIEQAAYAYTKAIDAGEKIIVGVNKFQTEQLEPPEVFPIDPAMQTAQIDRVQQHACHPRPGRGRRSLADVKTAASGTQNLLVPMKAALKARATLGEVSDTLRGCSGYTSPADDRQVRHHRRRSGRRTGRQLRSAPGRRGHDGRARRRGRRREPVGLHPLEGDDRDRRPRSPSRGRAEGMGLQAVQGDARPRGAGRARSARSPRTSTMSQPKLLESQGIHVLNGIGAFGRPAPGRGGSGERRPGDRRRRDSHLDRQPSAASRTGRRSTASGC